MGKRNVGRVICAAVITVGAVTAGASLTQAKGSGASKPVPTAIATCTGQGAGMVSVDQSGRRITLQVTASGVAPASGWHVTVTDTAAGVVASTAVGVARSEWAVVMNYESPKGARTALVNYSADDGSNGCSAVMRYNA